MLASFVVSPCLVVACEIHFPDSTVYSRSPLEGCPGCLASGVDTVLTMLVISTLLDGGLW